MIPTITYRNEPILLKSGNKIVTILYLMARKTILKFFLYSACFIIVGPNHNESVISRKNSCSINEQASLTWLLGLNVTIRPVGAFCHLRTLGISGSAFINKTFMHPNCARAKHPSKGFIVCNRYLHTPYRVVVL